MKENDILGKVLHIHRYMLLLSSKRGNSAEIEAAIGTTYLLIKVHVKRISKLLVSYLTRNLRICF